MDNTRLNPCPFCGGEAKFRVIANSSSHYDIGFEFEIKCRHCGVNSQKTHKITFSLSEEGKIDTLQDERIVAIENWNRRADNG